MNVIKCFREGMLEECQSVMSRSLHIPLIMALDEVHAPTLFSIYVTTFQGTININLKWGRTSGLGRMEDSLTWPIYDRQPRREDIELESNFMQTPPPESLLV